MFNPTGRLIKKKKSSIKFDTENPEFDETINVEVHGRTTRTKTSIRYAIENDREKKERRKERERKVVGEI